MNINLDVELPDTRVDTLRNALENLPGDATVFIEYHDGDENSLNVEIQNYRGPISDMINESYNR